MFDSFGLNSLTAAYDPLFLLFIVWTLVWTGIALWKAARAGSKPWFIALLVINSIGILEILYIFFFSKMGKKDKTE